MTEENQEKLSASMNIYQRLNEVRKLVSYIKKDATVRGYKAVTHDAVTRAVREGFVTHGILVVPTLVSGRMVETGSVTANGTPWWRYEATFNVQFVNCDTPTETTCLTIESHALDTDDKAPGKALSYAVKYAILKIMSLETGEDDEQRPEDIQEGRLLNMGLALRNNLDSVVVIKNGIATGDLSSACEAWEELSTEDKRAIWVAPTKGGIFTTEEREIIRSPEFLNANKVETGNE